MMGVPWNDTGVNLESSQQPKLEQFGKLSEYSITGL